MLANASTLPDRGKVDGHILRSDFAATTGAAAPSPPRHAVHVRRRRVRPPMCCSRKRRPATAVAPAAKRMRDRKQKRLNTVSSKLLEGTLIPVV